MITAEQIKGLTREDAEKVLKNADHRYRFTGIDDQRLLVTADCKADRFNLRVRNGVVIDCYMG